MNDDFNLTGNIKVIEWLKAELLAAVSSLYKGLIKGTKSSQDIILDCFAGIIILTYVLARRIGFEFSSIDFKVEDKLKLGIIEKDEIEKNYKDLSSLLGYIKDRKNA